VRRTKRIRIVIASALAAALALGLFHLRFSHAAAWRLSAEERPYVDRAVAGAARELRTSPEDIRRTTRPFVRRHPDRVCVRLRTGGTRETAATRPATRGATAGCCRRGASYRRSETSRFFTVSRISSGR